MTNSNTVISNRRVKHDYSLVDTSIVGIELSGAETKALRHGHGQLRGSYITIKDNELWLINATITGSPGIQISEKEQVRTRKLLAKRREIDNMTNAKQQGLTIVPVKLLAGGRFIKLQIATARGKKHYDKRHAIRIRDQNIDAQRALKERR